MKRVSFNEFFINVVTLVRFLCLIFVFGNRPSIKAAASSFATNPAGSSCEPSAAGNSSQRGPASKEND